MADGFDPRAPESRLLVARAQTGDRAALDALLGALQGPLYAHIRGIVRDPDAAKDALQDTLLLVARKLGTLREPQWVRAWVYRIATREAVRAARLSRRWMQELAGDAAIDAVPQPAADPPFEPELVARLPELVDSLPPASRAVLRLHYLEELTYPEIAEALEISIGTVKSRLAYGLAALRRSLGPTPR
jgi:RNA polymerase sigma-70 factor (ECF subfamily)